MDRSNWVRPLLVLTTILAMGLPGAGVVAAEPEGSVALDEALIAEVIEVLKESYVDDDVITSDTLSIGAIRGMVEALGDDGHTEYLTEDEYKIEQEVLKGRVVGVGIVLDQRSSAARVISVVDGSPAARAGLRAGDIIASVDDVEAARLPLGELADLVRGEPGTPVSLGIERAGSEEREVVSVVREVVEVDPVSWAMAPGSDVAVIRVVQFSVGSGYQVRDAVEDAISFGAVGIVLDLRGNPGGLVNETLNAASAFLDDGVVFLERARDEAPVDVRVDPGRAVDADIPVVVLADYGTASSGEILAAALRDNGRAVIVGEQTFGTGTILNTLRLSDGSALRLGVREWLTPSGERVFRTGVTPDERVLLPPGAMRLGPADLLGLTAADFEAADDVQLRRAVRAVEAAVVS
jgi:carboxyl-terminal processing protease